jgi:import inner membrane translocase subunit TIM13
MSFLGGSSASTGASQTQAIKQQVAQEAAVANARQLVEVNHQSQLLLSPISPFPTQHTNATRAHQKLNEHCFERCVPKPGSSLSSGESTCYSQCMEKYMSAWNVVSKQYINRIQREAGSGGLMM